MATETAPQSKKESLTLAQLAGYDDLITDVLVDHVYFWTTIRKNRARYFNCRHITEEGVADIVRKFVIIAKDPAAAAIEILKLPGVKRYVDRLASYNEKEHFLQHLRKYINIYLPDAPFEVSTTNRYTIDTQEAAVTARRYIKRGDIIKHLSGIQVPITREEEKTLDLTRTDFSIVMSSRKRTPSLFLGPARFANHDCDANARLATRGANGMSVIAAKDIEVGDEITVSYGDDYFGIDNSECLCATCESKQRNGWSADGEDEQDEDDEEEQNDTRLSRSRRGTASRDHSRSASEAPATPSRKRKAAEMQDFESTGRSPKRPELARLQGMKPRRMSSQLSHELRPEDIPGPGPAPEAEDDSSSPARSSVGSFMEDSSHSTAATSVNDVDPTTATKQADVATPTQRRADKSSEYSQRNDQDSTAIVGPDLDVPASDNNSAPAEITITDVNGLETSTPRGRQEASTPRSGSSSVSGDESSAAKTKKKRRSRTPGDYTLTAALLVGPHYRWVQCGVCDGDFVQSDAYQTRRACPRCERHSKLYGYEWPKTDKEGMWDTEERVKDHRTVNRFIHPEEEKAIGKGKEKALKRMLAERENESSHDDEDTDGGIRQRKKRHVARVSYTGVFTLDSSSNRDSDWEDVSGSPSRKKKSSDKTTLKDRRQAKLDQRRKDKAKQQKIRDNKTIDTNKRQYIRSGKYSRANRERLRQERIEAKQREQREQREAARQQRKRQRRSSVETTLLPPKPNLTTKGRAKPMDVKPEVSTKPSKWKGWAIVVGDNVPAAAKPAPLPPSPESEGRSRRRSAPTPAKLQQATTPKSRPSREPRSTRTKSTAAEDDAELDSDDWQDLPSATPSPVPAKRKYVRSGKYAKKPGTRVVGRPGRVARVRKQPQGTISGRQARVKVATTDRKKTAKAVATAAPERKKRKYVRSGKYAGRAKAKREVREYFEAMERSTTSEESDEDEEETTPLKRSPKSPKETKLVKRVARPNKGRAARDRDLPKGWVWAADATKKPAPADDSGSEDESASDDEDEEEEIDQDWLAEASFMEAQRKKWLHSPM